MTEMVIVKTYLMSCGFSIKKNQKPSDITYLIGGYNIPNREI